MSRPVSTLSQGAVAYVSALPEQDRALLAADLAHLAHLARHPDPAGDESGLRQSLALARRQRLTRAERLIRRAGNLSAPGQRGRILLLLGASWQVLRAEARAA